MFEESINRFIKQFGSGIRIEFKSDNEITVLDPCTGKTLPVKFDKPIEKVFVYVASGMVVFGKPKLIMFVEHVALQESDDSYILHIKLGGV